MPFSDLGLSESLLRAIAEKGYVLPFPIQVKAIPAVLSGKDIMAVAETGTGKTAGFTLPLLQRLSGGKRVQSNHIRLLILEPTRELAIQVAENVAAFGKYLSLKSGVVYGGVKINPQMMKLRGGLDVLVATPGRLLDLYGQNAVKFLQVETLVLDEADRLLDMGFLGDILKIIDLLPKRRQNLLFSATFSDDIRALAGNLLRNPQKIEVGQKNSTATGVKQWLYEVDKNRKAALLCHLIRQNDWQQVLVFTPEQKTAPTGWFRNSMGMAFPPPQFTGIKDRKSGVEPSPPSKRVAFVSWWQPTSFHGVLISMNCLRLLISIYRKLLKIIFIASVVPVGRVCLARESRW